MEFNEKLQELRKQRGITQEQLAESLFVSRTAVSKWEQGRGYPNIDSLKAIAEFFSITVDELLKSEELITIAKEDTKQRESHVRDRIFGLLDCSMLTFFFLPLFKQDANGVIESVSLLSLTKISSYLIVIYFALIIFTAVFGIFTLAMQGVNRNAYVKIKSTLSLALSIIGVMLFIISSQPYAAILLFVFLAIKVLMLIKIQ